jgi:hypothetical protein
LLEQEEDNTGPAERKRESGARRALRGAGGKGGVVLRLRARNAVNMIVTTAGGGEARLAEEFVVVCEYALDL